VLTHVLLSYFHLVNILDFLFLRYVRVLSRSCVHLTVEIRAAWLYSRCAAFTAGHIVISCYTDFRVYL
jgi:hypothetical protein